MVDKNEISKKENWSAKKKRTLLVLSIILIILIASIFVVFFMIGFEPPGGAILTGSFEEVNITSENSGIIAFGQFYPPAGKHPDVSTDEIVLLVMANSTPSGCIIFPSDGTGPADWVDSPSNETANYFCNSSQVGIFHAGDYIELSNLSPSTIYEFSCYHTYDHMYVTMIGDSAIISTPPNPPEPIYPDGPATMTAYEYVDEFYPGVPDYSKFELPAMPVLLIFVFQIGIIVDLVLMVIVAVKVR